ncbi:hypothetical protein JYU34_019789 [Plutella xylostella]|uniref:Uncharacterized protein n=1 Tax=Plutella xylostella TaxID=51655 RepID=A0ABQ7PWT5_PLUXY|nr:hypothetical protein JYU34_019789 [Plutella xylostella]
MARSLPVLHPEHSCLGSTLGTMEKPFARSPLWYRSCNARSPPDMQTYMSTHGAYSAGSAGACYPHALLDVQSSTGDVSPRTNYKGNSRAP